RGDIVSMGGAVKIDPGGKVRGSKMNMGSPKWGRDGETPEGKSGAGAAVHAARSFVRNLFGGVIGALTTFVVLFLVSLLVITFVPERARIVAREVLVHPLPTSLVGFMCTIALV